MWCPTCMEDHNDFPNSKWRLGTGPVLDLAIICSLYALTKKGKTDTHNVSVDFPYWAISNFV